MDTQTLIARKLHWTPALQRLMRVSTEWYDAIHGQKKGPRGGVPVAQEGTTVRFRTGYLGMNGGGDDGWFRLWNCPESTFGGMVRVVRSFGRELEWESCPVEVHRCVLPASLGTPTVSIGAACRVDLNLLIRCGVSSVNDSELQRALDNARQDNARQDIDTGEARWWWVLPSFHDLIRREY